MPATPVNGSGTTVGVGGGRDPAVSDTPSINGSRPVVEISVNRTVNGSEVLGVKIKLANVQVEAVTYSMPPKYFCE